MKRIAVFSAAALIGIGALTSTAAEARGGGAFAAGLVGGLAAGALIGAASGGYGYGYAEPRYGYGYGYRSTGYGYVPRPGFGDPSFTRRYDDGYGGYGPVSYGGYRHCDRPFGYRGW